MSKSDDLISRRAAITALIEDKIQTKIYITATAERDSEVFNGACDRHAKMLKELPSAQPKIVMCKDCKYGQAHNPDGSIICEHWDDNAVSDDDFCSYAERRTDE